MSFCSAATRKVLGKTHISPQMPGSIGTAMALSVALFHACFCAKLPTFITCTYYCRYSSTLRTQQFPHAHVSSTTANVLDQSSAPYHQSNTTDYTKQHHCRHQQHNQCLLGLLLAYPTKYLDTLC